LIATFFGHSQTNADSTSIKNEEAKKRVLNNLIDQHIMYSIEQDFDFINYLKPEKIDCSMKINYKETQEEKAIKMWCRYKNQNHTWPKYYPEFRTEKYFFTTY
jgi:hypothetical protein